LCSELVQAGKHDPAGRNRHSIWIERGQPPSDDIRVHELVDAKRIVQQRRRDS